MYYTQTHSVFTFWIYIYVCNNTLLSSSEEVWVARDCAFLCEKMQNRIATLLFKMSFQDCDKETAIFLNDY